jgi:hypothetical protein
MEGKQEFVEFRLKDDPQVYKLSYDFNAICEAEAAAGCNLIQAFLFQAPLTAVQTRAILFACLKKAHPLVLLTEAGELLSRDMPVVLDALGQAMRGDEQEEEGEGEESDEEKQVELPMEMPLTPTPQLKPEAA